MKRNEKLILLVCVLAVILGFVIMFGNPISLPNKEYTSTVEVPQATGVTNELTNTTTIKQSFKCGNDSIKQLALVFNKTSEFEENDEAYINVNLLNGTEELVNKNINIANIGDQHRLYIDLKDTYSNMSGKELTLVISTTCSKTGLLVMMQENNNSSFKFGNLKINGTICFSLN